MSEHRFTVYVAVDFAERPDGRIGTVTDVNVYGAAIVCVTFDGISLVPFLFYDLEKV